MICVSATPAEFELSRADQVVEQIIRPTGLLDPEVEVRPVETQIDDLIGEINERVSKGERVIVTTLTTKMAEDLTDYIEGHGISVKYIHHEVETMERMEILRDLRLGAFDVIVGINLLREGIDLPEVTLVAILDADKEGFLRSETSLIQMIGRAARNVGGKVIMYADHVTESMKRAIDETARRRKKQSEYNEKHGVTPQTVKKDVRELISIGSSEEGKRGRGVKREKPTVPATAKEKDRLISQLESEMKEAAKMLRFEEAAYLRDRIKELRETK